MSLCVGASLRLLRCFKVSHHQLAQISALNSMNLTHSFAVRSAFKKRVVVNAKAASKAHVSRASASTTNDIVLKCHRTHSSFVKYTPHYFRWSCYDFADRNRPAASSRESPLFQPTRPSIASLPARHPTAGTSRKVRRCPLEIRSVSRYFPRSDLHVERRG